MIMPKYISGLMIFIFFCQVTLPPALPAQEAEQPTDQKVTGPTLSPDRGGLRVTSTPEGATVYLNKSEVGRTPLELLDLKPSDYDIRVYLEGYEEFLGISNVDPGEIVDINIPLKQIATPGFLEITANISKADIFLDGRKLGEAPLAKWPVRAGEHKVKLGLSGYSDWQTRIKLKTGETLRINARLKKKTATWYKNPWVWGAILAVAGGTAAAVAVTVGGGGDDNTRTIIFHY